MRSRPTIDDALLTECDREPIHVPGSIQPHGALVALDPDTLEVLQAAGDVQGLLGKSIEDLLGKSLGVEAPTLRLATMATSQHLTPRPAFAFEANIKGAAFDAIAHLSGGLLVLELEPQADQKTVGGIELVQAMMRRTEVAADVGGLCRAIAQGLQGATGYDRVMVYQFQVDDSGHVVAEARSSDDVEPYFDLHYPAADIPVQARALYLRNWMRCIPDARYRPAPLIPSLNPKTGAPLDLSLSHLRSVSPVHLEYLANMGVRSSMSLSLVVDGRLWGLVACHHKEPLFLDYRLRAACELFAQLASLQIQNRVAADLSHARARSSEIQLELVKRVSKGDLPHTLLHGEPNLLSFIQAAGVAVVSEGEVTTRGIAPAPDELAAMVAWLDRTLENGRVLAIDCVSESWPEGPPLANEICGVLALAVSREPKDFLIWFLPEMRSDVRWAGEAQKASALTPAGERLSPRKSFEAWTEIVRGHSRPWTDVEVEGAGMLSIAILEIVLRRRDLLVRERERAKGQQDLLLAELDHRVKNTLATIQSMVRFSSRSASDLAGFVGAIELRLQSMAKTHNALAQSRWEGAHLRAIVDDELRAHRHAGESIAIDGPDFVLEPKAAMAISMVLHELTTNAVKYGGLSKAGGALVVNWGVAIRDGQSWLRLRWIESCASPITQPTRRGFGRTLLERVFAQDVDGRVESTFAPTGLSYTLEIPMARVSLAPPQASSPDMEAPAPSRTGVPLAGLKILLVEDAPLVAEDLATQLRSLGALVVGPFFRLADGLLAVKEIFDVALLDVDLDTERVWSLADALRRSRTPFILTTGFSGATSWPDRFKDQVVVSKPYNIEALQLAITMATGDA